SPMKGPLQTYRTRGSLLFGNTIGSFVTKGFSMTHYASSPASFANSGSACDCSVTNYGAKKSDEADKWAKIWFKQFCWFHRCSPNRGWQFSLDQVIQFLKSRVSKGA
ncbi:hypothetical protein N9Y42_06080, partial [Mariniblastus sp.]|nr:hypothetical protein [Mariniblastus sp.]